MADLNVSDLMTRDVSVIRKDRDVHELEQLLLREKIHGAPVVDESDRLVGVISQTDLLAWHYTMGVDGAAFYDYSNLLVRDEGDFKGLKLSDIQTATVEEVMSPVVHCIGPDRSVAQAAAMMVQRQVHRLIVVNDDLHVLGVISAIDVLCAIPGAKEVLATPEAARID